MTEAFDGLVAEMRRLEEAVKTSDGDGIRARWQSGRKLLELRAGKRRLPNGVLEKLVEDLGVSQSELNARMKFAEKCPPSRKLPMPSESTKAGSRSCMTR